MNRRWIQRNAIVQSPQQWAEKKKKEIEKNSRDAWAGIDPFTFLNLFIHIHLLLSTHFGKHVSISGKTLFFSRSLCLFEEVFENENGCVGVKRNNSNESQLCLQPNKEKKTSARNNRNEPKDFYFIFSLIYVWTASIISYFAACMKHFWYAQRKRNENKRI